MGTVTQAAGITPYSYHKITVSPNTSLLSNEKDIQFDPVTPVFYDFRVEKLEV